MNHESLESPSVWVERFLRLIPASAPVLDLAAGKGRHTRLLLAQGYSVVAVDRDVTGLAAFEGRADLAIVEMDLESSPAKLPGDRPYAGIVITNYLYRPILPLLASSLINRGVLIYETFARGNERFGRPRNPDHLLREGELLEFARERLRVVAYEHGIIARPRAAVVQRLCAVRPPPRAGDVEADPLDSDVRDVRQAAPAAGPALQSPAARFSTVAGVGPSKGRS